MGIFSVNWDTKITLQYGMFKNGSLSIVVVAQPSEICLTLIIWSYSSESVSFAICITKYHILPRPKVYTVIWLVFNMMIFCVAVFSSHCGSCMHEIIDDIMIMICSCCGHLRWTPEGRSFSSVLGQSVSSSPADQKAQWSAAGDGLQYARVWQHTQHKKLLI